MKFSFLFFSIFFGLFIHDSEAAMTGEEETFMLQSSDTPHRRASLAQTYPLSSSPKFEAWLLSANQERAVKKTAQGRERIKRYFSEDCDSCFHESGYTSGEEEIDLAKKRPKEESSFPFALGGSKAELREPTATTLVPGMKDLTLHENRDASSDAPLVPGDKDLLFPDDDAFFPENPAMGVCLGGVPVVDDVFPEDDSFIEGSDGIITPPRPLLGASPQEAASLSWRSKAEWPQWYKDQIEFQNAWYKNPEAFQGSKGHMLF